MIEIQINIFLNIFFCFGERQEQKKFNRASLKCDRSSRVEGLKILVANFLMTRSEEII